jgi:hypothetical protein
MRALYYRLRYPRAFVWGFWGTGDELNAGALRSALRCPMPEGEAWRGFEHVVEMRNMDSYRVITRDSRGTLASWTAAKTTQAFGVCAPHTLPGLAARDAWAVSASGVVFVAPDGNVYESTLVSVATHLREKERETFS